jgi:hypothetical protein
MIDTQKQNLQFQIETIAYDWKSNYKKEMGMHTIPFKVWYKQIDWLSKTFNVDYFEITDSFNALDIYDSQQECL